MMMSFKSIALYALLVPAMVTAIRLAPEYSQQGKEQGAMIKVLKPNPLSSSAPPPPAQQQVSSTLASTLSQHVTIGLETTASTSSLPPNLTEHANTTTTTLSKRKADNYSPFSCGDEKFREAWIGKILSGIDHLRLVLTKPHSSPDASGEKCGRISCEWTNEIYWCNHNKNDLTLDSFDIVADAAQYLVDVCASDDDRKREYVNGRVWHTDGWSVIIRKEKCHKYDSLNQK